MKKTITFFLAALLTVAMGIPALAATNNGGDSTADVNGIYKAGQTAPDTISAEIAWQEMTFTYMEGEKNWNPGTHKVDQAAGTWADEQKSITVTNHSNTGIKATFAFVSTTGITGAFDRAELLLATAAGTEVSAAPKDAAYFRITGGTLQGSGALGTITVTIGKLNVATEADLRASVAGGGTVQVCADITLATVENISVVKTTVIDLGGHTVTGGPSPFFTQKNVDCTLQNGTLTCRQSQGEAVFAHGNVTLKNCVLNGTECGVNVAYGTVTLTDCTVNADEYAARIQLGGTLILEGVVTINIRDGVLFRFDTPQTGTLIVRAGTYNFDPTAYVDTAAYTVTDNGDGTFTVSAS